MTDQALGCGCWMAWHYSQDYHQGDVKVFGTEVEALRWALGQQAGHRVVFVRWGQSPLDVVAAERDTP